MEAPGQIHKDLGLDGGQLGPRDHSHSKFRIGQQPRGLMLVSFTLSFVSSAAFFLSGILALFSAIPLWGFWARRRYGLWVLSILSNLTLVISLGGISSAVLYLAWVIPVGFFMPLILSRAKNLSYALGICFSAVLLLSLMVAAWAARQDALPLLAWLKQSVFATLDLGLSGMGDEVRSQVIGAQGGEYEWKLSVWRDLPWRAAAFAWLWVWINASLILRMNANRVREKMGLSPQFIRQWKASEFLLWPTIAAGAAYVFGSERVQWLGQNFLFFFLTLYAVQGLAVLIWALDAWRVRGFLRPILLMVTLFFALPMVVGFGFFDQWFDFRTKFRQT